MVGRILLATIALIPVGTGCVTVAASSRAEPADVSGGGCPANSSVIFTTEAGEPLGSITADAEGAYSRRVNLGATGGLQRAAVVVVCGSMIIRLSVTLVDQTSTGTPAWLGVAVGAAILGVVILSILRRRSAAAGDEDGPSP
jgi:hypothetical protein